MTQAQAFYEYEDVPDSDEEMSIGHGSASDMSAASSQAGPLASHASTAVEERAEVISKAPGSRGDSPNQSTNSNGTLHTAADAGGSAAAVGNGHGADMLRLNSAGSEMAAPQLSDSAAVQLLDAATCQHQERVSETEPGIESHSEANPVVQLQDRQKDTDSPGSPVHTVAATAAEAMEPGEGKDVSQSKRKEATVFDQGVAAQAEAADLDAGIAAQEVDHQNPALESTGEVDVTNESLDGTGEMQITNESNDANTDAFLAVTHADVTVPDGVLQFKPTRKALPKSAPWR